MRRNAQSLSSTHTTPNTWRLIPLRTGCLYKQTRGREAEINQLDIFAHVVGSTSIRIQSKQGRSSRCGLLRPGTAGRMLLPWAPTAVSSPANRVSWTILRWSRQAMIIRNSALHKTCRGNRGHHSCLPGAQSLHQTMHAADRDRLEGAKARKRRPNEPFSF